MSPVFLGQFNRTAEEWSLEGTSGDHLQSKPPVQAGSASIGCPRPYPAGF